MKSLLLCMFFMFAPLAQSKVIANYTYLKAKKPVKKTITHKEVKQYYDIIKRSTFNPPSQDQMFKDFLRFKMGVEVALNEKKLVRSPGIESQIMNPFLKAAFHDILYKHLGEIKLSPQMKRLDKTSANLSKKTLKRLYAFNPEFNVFWIAVNLPSTNPSPRQLNEAKQRARKIHSQIIKSKKPFLELVALYSDDKSNGTLGINRSRASIPPAVFGRLKGMKTGAISPPVKVPYGYIIVKLNRKVPFSEANHMAIKANYFNEKRAKIYNNYFDNLRKDFKVNIVNPALIKTI